MNSIIDSKKIKLEDQVLVIENLSKHYGRVKALSGLNLSVLKGQVFGLLGPNGSGKTTALSIILGVTMANNGNFRWFGQSLCTGSLKRIGALLETPNFYPYLDAVNNLRIVAGIRNVPESDINRVLRLTGLYDRRKHRFQTYSYGMKQRLAIAGALLGKPEVLILDEPTNGLDPGGIAEIRQLISGIAAEGATIILASHLLDEVQKVCTHVAVLQKGAKLFSGNVDEVPGNSETLILSAEDPENLEKAILGYYGYQSHKISGDFLELKITGDLNPGEVNEYLFNNGVICTHLSIRKKSLETYFLEITGNKSESVANAQQ